MDSGFPSRPLAEWLRLAPIRDAKPKWMLPIWLAGRFPVPSRCRHLRRLFDAQLIGMTTVMMDIVNQWDGGGLADGQQVTGREDLVVDFDGQAAPYPR